MDEVASMADSFREIVYRWRFGVTAIVAVSALALVGCSAADNEPAPMQLVSPDLGYIQDIAWLPGGQLYALRRNSSDGPSEIVELNSDKRLQPVFIQEGEFCKGSQASDLSALPDGRLGAVLTCESSNLPAFGPDTAVAVAVENGMFVKLASLGGPHRLIAWEEGLADGWVEFLTGQCRSIARFVDDEVVQFPEYRPADLIPWDLDQDFFGRSSCETPGRAGFVVPVRSGEIYFLASREAEDSLGGPSDRPRWGIFAFNPESRRLRKLGPDFEEPRDVAIVPNETAILVSGRHDNKMGVWGVDSTSGAVSLIAPGSSFASISPADDNRRVAVVRSTGKGYEVVQLEIASNK